jgi:transcription initiation factor TFIIH subunit 3
MNCSEFLFPPPPAAVGMQPVVLRQLDGQYELFTHVERTIRQNLQQLVMRDAKSVPAGSACESLLAGALAMALCYIHRYYTELSTHMCEVCVEP